MMVIVVTFFELKHSVDASRLQGLFLEPSRTAAKVFAPILCWWCSEEEGAYSPSAEVAKPVFDPNLWWGEAYSPAAAAEVAKLVFDPNLSWGEAYSPSAAEVAN